VHGQRLRVADHVVVERVGEYAAGSPHPVVALLVGDIDARVPAIRNTLGWYGFQRNPCPVYKRAGSAGRDGVGSRMTAAHMLGVAVDFIINKWLPQPLTPCSSSETTPY
jgi:hypothetical protein